MTEVNTILEFVSQFGYWIAVPVMIIEGPLITILMGFLSSLGVFSIFNVIALSFLADMVSDAIYYWSGYHGGPKVMEKLKITAVQDNDVLLNMKQKFRTHPGKIFFGAKVLTGVAHTTFVLAGVMKIPYPQVLKYSIPGGIIWSSALASLGFFFGSYATNITQLLTRTGLVLFAILVLFLIYKFWLGEVINRRYKVWRAASRKNQSIIEDLKILKKTKLGRQPWPPEEENIKQSNLEDGQPQD